MATITGFVLSRSHEPEASSMSAVWMGHPSLYSHLDWQGAESELEKPGLELMPLGKKSSVQKTVLAHLFKRFIYFENHIYKVKWRKTERDVFPPLIHSSVAHNDVGPGQNQESGASSGPPTWVAGVQVFVSSPTVFTNCSHEAELKVK